MLLCWDTGFAVAGRAACREGRECEVGVKSERCSQDSKKTVMRGAVQDPRGSSVDGRCGIEARQCTGSRHGQHMLIAELLDCCVCLLDGRVNKSSKRESGGIT